MALLAIVSMIPLSYDANRKAVNATRYAQLAEDILSALRAEAAACQDRASFQVRFAGGTPFAVPVSSVSEWSAPPTITINDKSKLIFKSMANPELVSHELTCTVTTLPADSFGGLYACKVQVKIWPGIGDDFEKLTPYEITRLLTNKDLSNAP